MTQPDSEPTVKVSEKDAKRLRLVAELVKPSNHVDGKMSMPMLEAAEFLFENAKDDSRIPALVKELKDPTSHQPGTCSVYMLEAAEKLRSLKLD
jgi:hypothetical protein